MRRRKSRGSKKSLLLAFLLVTIGIVVLFLTGNLKVSTDASASVISPNPKNYQVTDLPIDKVFENKSIVFFSSSWCGPCQRLSTELKKLAEDPINASVDFYEVNIETNRDLANKYQAYLTPAIVFASKSTKPAVYQEVNLEDLNKIVSRFALQ